MLRATIVFNLADRGLQVGCQIEKSVVNIILNNTMVLKNASFSIAHLATNLAPTEIIKVHRLY